jgi:hypothetical protein
MTSSNRYPDTRSLCVDASGAEVLDKDHSEALRKVVFTIGQGVLLYQQIELHLKALLPLMGPSAAASGADALAAVQRLVASRETMGTLAARLMRSIEVDHPEGFATYLEQIVKNRNELVHTFTALPVGRLRTVASCNEALAYLNDRRRYALPLAQLIQQTPFGCRTDPRALNFPTPLLPLLRVAR